MALHVCIDDTDPSIQYEGPWFVAANNLVDNGDFGAPYNQTLRGVNSNASLNFSFNGTQISVLGSSLVDDDSDSAAPTFDCFVDGSRIPSLGWPEDAQNNWELCRSGQLPPGTHQLRLVATVPQSATFWFDQIQYIPTPETSLVDKAIGIENSNPMFSFGSGWQELRGSAHFTQTSGSVVEFAFTGTSVTWYGFVLEDFLPAPAEASYSIDGQPETTFLLQGHATDDDNHFNHVFFQTPTLAYGEHTIRVTHRGDSTMTPLVLDYIVIGPGSTSDSTSLSNSGQTTLDASGSHGSTLGAAPTPTPTSHITLTPATLPFASGQKNIGSIIGAAVASACLFFGLIALIYLIAKQRHQRKPGPAPLEDETPAFVDPAPPVYAFTQDYDPNRPSERDAVVDMHPDMSTTHGYLPSVKSGAISRTPTNLSLSESTVTISTPRTAHTWDRRTRTDSFHGVSYTTHSTLTPPIPNASLKDGSPTPSELRAVNGDHVVAEGPGSPVSVSLSRNSTNGSSIQQLDSLPRIVRHRDSGLRSVVQVGNGVEPQNLRAILELPPLYSSG